ncbi:serine hydrolase domain-containing protein [Chryseobacterium sp. A321]
MKLFQKSTVYFVVLLLTLGACESKKPDLKPTQKPKDYTLVDFQRALYQVQLDSLLNKSDFNGIVSIMQNGELLFQKSKGFENFKEKIPISDSSVFAIASVSKQFAAVLTLQLVDQGKLNLEDSVSSYLSEFKKPSWNQIKVSQLLNHTSGIVDFAPNLVSIPGQQYHYSNKGINFVGQLLETVSSQKLEKLQSHLFSQVGLHNTYPASHSIPKNFASAYTGPYNSVHVVPNMPQRLLNEQIGLAAGGILSTAKDLHKWNQALYSGTLLSQASAERMQSSVTKATHPILGDIYYGYGLMISRGQPESYFHTGYVKGSASLLLYYPQSQTSVVILSNHADERQGKQTIFKHHKEIKKQTDRIELALEQMKKKELY